MRIWHVGAGSSTAVTKRLLGLGLRNLMVSAWSHYRESLRLTEAKADMIRKGGGHVFVDSGMISALHLDPSWADEQDLVAALARRVGAELVSHLDVPMERHKLAAARMTRRDALRITIRNARDFLDADVGDATKVYVVQGWTMPEYVECLDAFADAGIPDGGWLGIGTCCMRKPTRGLWQILEEVRRRTDGTPLHSFGTGDPDKLVRLARIGIDSVDEGNTIRALIYRTPNLERLVGAYRGYDA